MAETLVDVGQRLDAEYTIQQAAELTGMSEHTLRYYERIGLISSIRRDESSRHRRYTLEDIRRMESMACLRATGMPIELMRRYFELEEPGRSAASARRQMLESHRLVLEDRMRQMEDHLRYLERKIGYLRSVEDAERSARP